MISRLQYLTQDLVELDHLKMVEEACKLGSIDWIQLRIKNKRESQRYEIAQKAMEICKFWKVKLIINDYVEIAASIDANGVHLGKNDMPIEAARTILGNDKIIGGTANSLEDIQQLVASKVDYLGVGPFRYTATKKNLSKLLGVEGYIDIVEKCKQEGIDIPLIAIGGIQLEDVVTILETGVYGIAVSSAINLSNDRGKQMIAFKHRIQEFKMKQKQCL